MSLAKKTPKTLAMENAAGESAVGMPFSAEAEDTLRKYYERYDYNELGITSSVEFRQLMLSAVYHLHLHWSPQVEARVEKQASGCEHGDVVHFTDFCEFLQEIFLHVDQQPEVNPVVGPGLDGLRKRSVSDAPRQHSEQARPSRDHNTGNDVKETAQEKSPCTCTFGGKVESTEQSDAQPLSTIQLEEANYHTWAALTATQPENSWIGGLLPLVLSFLLLAMQLSMCILTVRELNSPRCLSDTCASGMVCLGLGDGEAGGEGNSGSCYVTQQFAFSWLISFGCIGLLLCANRSDMGTGICPRRFRSCTELLPSN